MSDRPERWWARDAYRARRPKLLQRQAILSGIRGFFSEQDFVEVETSALQVSPGLEPHLQAFATDLLRADGSVLQRYLHTSPEFACKKLLAAGEPQLFTLAKVFRNGERAATHHPEFTLLEWYRADPDMERLFDDCEALLRAAARAAGVQSLQWQGQSVDPFQAFERVTVEDAFQRYAGIDLFASLANPAAPDAAVLRAAARSRGVRVADDDSWADLVTKVMLERIEPKLGIGRPTFLTDYPIALAALARPKAQAPHLAERFEIYVAGLELANAFGELTDPEEQRRRFEADMDLKQQLYGLRYPIDEGFLAALSEMPAACGIALGVDRLVMLLTGAAHIEDVLWAPVE